MDVVFLAFVIGAIFGWIIEKFYRRWIHKEWVRTGLLYGFYLPIYGFCAAILYLLTVSDISIIIKLLVALTAPIILEFIGGNIFIRQYGIKLWDYTDERYNYQGIICLKYSAIQGVLSVGAFYFILKYGDYLREFIAYEIVQYITLGIIIIIIIDTFFTFKNKIFRRLKKAAEEGKKIVEQGKIQSKIIIDNSKKIIEENKKKFEKDGERLLKKVKKMY